MRMFIEGAPQGTEERTEFMAFGLGQETLTKVSQGIFTISLIL